MNRFIIWTESDIQGLSKTKGVTRLYTEIDKAGLVIREIGLNQANQIVHISPSESDQRGVFDLAKVAITKFEDDLTSDEFERLWYHAKFSE